MTNIAGLIAQEYYLTRAAAIERYLDERHAKGTWSVEDTALVGVWYLLLRAALAEGGIDRPAPKLPWVQK